MSDPFAFLGLEQDADERTIKRAYARKLKETRPDENQQAFQDLNAAYRLALQMAAWRASSPILEPDRDETPPQPIASISADDSQSSASEAEILEKTKDANPADGGDEASAPGKIVFNYGEFYDELSKRAQDLNGDLAPLLEDSPAFWDLNLKLIIAGILQNTIVEQQPGFTPAGAQAIVDFFDLEALRTGRQAAEIAIWRRHIDDAQLFKPENRRRLIERLTADGKPLCSKKDLNWTFALLKRERIGFLDHILAFFTNASRRVQQCFHAFQKAGLESRDWPFPPVAIAFWSHQAKIENVKKRKFFRYFLFYGLLISSFFALSIIETPPKKEPQETKYLIQTKEQFRKALDRIIYLHDVEKAYYRAASELPVVERLLRADGIFAITFPETQEKFNKEFRRIKCVALLNAKQNQQAIEACEDAIKAYPDAAKDPDVNLPIVYECLGLATFRIGHYRASANAFEQGEKAAKEGGYLNETIMRLRARRAESLKFDGVRIAALAVAQETIADIERVANWRQNKELLLVYEQAQKIIFEIKGAP